MTDTTGRKEPLERIADALEQIAGLMAQDAARKAEGQAEAAAAQTKADEAWAQDALDKGTAAGGPSSGGAED